MIKKIILTISLVAIIAIGAITFSLIKNFSSTSAQDILVGFFRGANWGIIRDEKIEELAVNNSQLEIKLVNLYAFEGNKDSKPTRECNITLRYTNISPSDVLFSTDSGVNSLYKASQRDLYVDIEITPNQPEKYKNLFAAESATTLEKLPKESFVTLAPNNSLEKKINIKCPDDLLYGFTYYYDPKDYKEVSSMPPIQIIFDFTQGG